MSSHRVGHPRNRSLLDKPCEQIFARLKLCRRFATRQEHALWIQH